MDDDVTLLRRYAAEGSEPAFTELVHRHVNLVYNAALRRTGDAHGAADVTQQVFIKVARNARRLSRHTVFSAWLHTSTRNAAINFMISERRRKTRESEALDLSVGTAADGVSLDWDRLRTVLDSAIDELAQADRDAVVLRFLEHRAFAEIGVALRVSEDAARMRTERALEKLRLLLVRRGITSTAAALSGMVTGQVAVSAPAGFAADVVTRSLQAAASVGAGSFLLFMTTKTVSTAAVSAVIALGLGAYFGSSYYRDASALFKSETQQQTRIVTSPREENQSLKAEVDRLATDAVHPNSDDRTLVVQRAAQSNTIADPLTAGEKQKRMTDYLKQIDSARSQYQNDKGHSAISI